MVDPEQVRIVSIDVDEDGHWIAWGYVEGDVGAQYIVAEQDGAHRWHVADGSGAPHPAIMTAIKNHVLSVMCKAVGE